MNYKVPILYHTVISMSIPKMPQLAFVLCLHPSQSSGSSQGSVGQRLSLTAAAELAIILSSTMAADAATEKDCQVFGRGALRRRRILDNLPCIVYNNIYYPLSQAAAELLKILESRAPEARDFAFMLHLMMFWCNFYILITV